jgi:cysteine synthase
MDRTTLGRNILPLERDGLIRVEATASDRRVKGVSRILAKERRADAVNMGVIDRILPIPNGDALRCSRELAQKEGIFVGITAGATFAGG